MQFLDNLSSGRNRKLPQLPPSFRCSLSRSPRLFLSRILQQGICIINCQQRHKIFSLVFCRQRYHCFSFSFSIFVFRASFVLFYLCYVVSIAAEKIFKNFGQKSRRDAVRARGRERISNGAEIICFELFGFLTAQRDKMQLGHWVIQ